MNKKMHTIKECITFHPCVNLVIVKSLSKYLEVFFLNQEYFDLIRMIK